LIQHDSVPPPNPRRHADLAIVDATTSTIAGDHVASETRPALTLTERGDMPAGC
jgi:hypothetical protein